MRSSAGGRGTPMFLPRPLGEGWGEGAPSPLTRVSVDQRPEAGSRPTVGDPAASLRGNLSCLLHAGRSATRFARTSGPPDPRSTALLGAATGGSPISENHKYAPWRVLVVFAFGLHPSDRACVGALWTDQGRALSERSEFARTPFKAFQRGLPAAKLRVAGGRVRLSLPTFFGEAKKVGRRRGDSPAPGRRLSGALPAGPGRCMP